MRIETWPIDRPKPYPNNPRINDDAVKGVADSIQAFGWQQPIVVDSDGVVIVGHTRLKAAKLLGLKEVPVTVASDLTPDEVAAYRLADNRTAEKAAWDMDALKLELKGIELDMSPWFSGQDMSAYNPDDFGTDFTLDDSDAPHYRHVALELSQKQFDVLTAAVEKIDRAECQITGGNEMGDKVTEIILQWAN